MKIFQHKKLLLLTATVLIILTIGWFLFPKSNNTNIQTAIAKKGDILSSVSASGNLNGHYTANLKFKSSGKLAYINVNEGDKVAKGEIIAGFDTQDLSIALTQAYNTLRSKQAIAEKILDDVKDHKSDETFTQKQNRTQAESDRDNAFDDVKAAQRAFQDATLVSPIDGIVSDVALTAGQFAGASDLVAQIVDWSKVYFDAEVDEADLSRVRIDQAVKVNLNAYPDREFTGTVDEILPQTKTTSAGATVVTVRIDLHNPDIHLISGLNGQADIITQQRTGVLVIPLEAIKDDNTVFIKNGKNIKPVKVKLGLKSDTEAEIIEGLNPDDEVVKNPQ